MEELLKKAIGEQTFSALSDYVGKEAVDKTIAYYEQHPEAKAEELISYLVYVAGDEEIPQGSKEYERRVGEWKRPEGK